MTWSANVGVSWTRKRNRRLSMTASLQSSNAVAVALAGGPVHQRHLAEGLVGADRDGPAVWQAQLDRALGHAVHLLTGGARLEDDRPRGHVPGVGGRLEHPENLYGHGSSLRSPGPAARTLVAAGILAPVGPTDAWSFTLWSRGAAGTAQWGGDRQPDPVA